MKLFLALFLLLLLSGCGSDPSAPSAADSPDPTPVESPSPAPSPSASPGSGQNEITCSVLGIVVYEGTVNGPITGSVDGCWTFTDAYGPFQICADCTITPG